MARSGQFNRRENGHVTEVASLVQGEWSCYRGGHFNGGRMVTLQKWSLQWTENGHVTEVVSLEIENGHITLVVILNMERRGMIMLQRWSLIGGRMVILQKWSL